MSISLLIVDDEEVVRAGVARWLANTEFELVGEVNTAAEAVRLAALRHPQVVLAEARLGGVDSLRALAAIKQQRPSTALLIFSSLDSPALAAGALAAKASGYLLKNSNRESLLLGLRRVAAGEHLWTPEELRRLNGALASPRRQGLGDANLTNRETEVLKHLSLGQTNKEIAATLNISPETVKEHVQRLLRKIGVRDRTQAAVWMVRHAANGN